MPLGSHSLYLAVELVQCQCRHCKGFQEALELFEPGSKLNGDDNVNKRCFQLNH